MKMRYKPLRGEKYKIDGKEFTILDVVKSESDLPADHSVRVLTPEDKISVVPIQALNLPVIDTKDYERLRQVGA